MAGLTLKQSRFIDEYLIDLNGTQAAIRTGYSAKTANEQAARLLANVSIKKEIDDRLAKQQTDAIVSREMVLRGLLSEAQCMGEGSSHSARVGAWAHLGKHLNMFTDKVDHNINGNLAHTITVKFDD